ncbi:MAG: DUF4380 domain-containing protein [Bacteroidales bacterium]
MSEQINIEYIENNGIRIGIAPEIGGTIVSLHMNDSKNILCANEELVHSTFRPEISPEADFYPYNGHTIWLGPQSAWWTQQSENTERKNEAAPWPPDPYIVYGPYDIIQKQKHTITVRSNISPVWGVQVEKSIAINTDGSVFLSAIVQSVAEHPIAWDIWFNTRMHGFDKVYVPVENHDFKVEHVYNEQSTEMPYEYAKQHFFTYTPQAPPEHKNERGSKAYIYPATPDIYAFSQNHLLHISFEKYAKDVIHPEQGHVEIFNRTAHNPAEGLLELEYHAPYTKLMPGESMQSWEVWNIASYNGEHNKDKHIQFLDTYIK